MCGYYIAFILKIKTFSLVNKIVVNKQRKADARIIAQEQEITKYDDSITRTGITRCLICHIPTSIIK